MSKALIFLVIIGVVIAIFDIRIAMKEGFSQTISWQLYLSSRKYPIIPFLFGLLAGHLFFSQIYV